MDNLLRPLLDQIHKIWDAIDRKAEIKLGVVAAASPLRVALDGDIDTNNSPVLAPAQSFVADLTTGQRVVCAVQHRRVIVIQAA